MKAKKKKKMKINDASIMLSTQPNNNQADFDEGEEEEEEEDKIAAKTEGIKFLVKQNNQFKCISTPTLKFLDITSYLTPWMFLLKYLVHSDEISETLRDRPCCSTQRPTDSTQKPRLQRMMLHH